MIKDYDQLIADIKTNGISATDRKAESKIETYMLYLIRKTTYKRKTIIEKVREATQDYFYGYPLQIVDEQLNDTYDRLRVSKKRIDDTKRVLTLYQSEMETISSITDSNLQKLAFAALIYQKYTAFHYDGDKIAYYGKVKTNNAEIFHLAKLENCSGSKKNKLWHCLIEQGLIITTIETNNIYKYKSTHVGTNMFFCTFSQDFLAEEKRSKVFMTMANFDDIFLYLRKFQNDIRVGICTACGSPMEIPLKSINAKKKYCSCCAHKRKLSSKKPILEEGKKEKIETA